MIISKTNLDIWYKEYLKQRERTIKYVKSRKGSLRDTAVLNRAEFEIDFRSEVGDNPKLSGQQIAKRMAKQELYVYSYKEGKRFAEAHAEEFGGEVNISLIMQYRMETKKDIWDVINIRRNELVAEGKSTYRANIIISQEFFGSPV